MIAGITQDNTSSLVGTSRYWYGLPPWPMSQYAFTRQFDAGQYLQTLFFSQQPTEQNPPPAFFVEINALSILKDTLTPVQSDAGAISDGLTRLLIGRLWPSDVQQTTQTTTSSSTAGADTLIGQLLNSIA